VDLDLARRLERAEAENSRSYIETRARLEPGSGAAWLDVAGTYALFDGVGSPLTQTFGLGLFGEAGERELGSLERFFASRGSEVQHEVSPLADVATFATLAARGYRPVELTSLMYRSVEPGLSLDVPINPRIVVRRAGPGEADLFASVAARGWSETPAVVPFVQGLARVFAERPGGASFLAEIEGVPIAAAALGLSGGVALLAGASTVPEGRRQGAQLALLDRRLRYGAQQGCDLAMMGAAPGSGSQRNAERHGFRIAYTRVKWGLTPARTLAHVSFLVRDYEEAIAYFTAVLGFELIEDTPRGPQKRWVIVAPPGGRGTSLLLARAATPEQAARIGSQTGGRVFLFLHSDDFRRDYHAMLERGVRFIESPRDEAYGTVAVFEDLYGNKWDLVQKR